MTMQERKGHAVLDVRSRALKAAKIAYLLGLPAGGPPRRLLEIGCGSGGIAHWFGASGAMGWDVDAVDVEDVRRVYAGYRFSIVRDTRLPFADASYDVVLTNHVIEHVGGSMAQCEHLREVRRVLRPGGRAYLAVPSRWMVVEPHFRLPLLSWLPRSLADAYVRAAGRGTHYDCRPLTCGVLERMLEETGFRWRQHTGDAMRSTYELENPSAPIYRYVLANVPDRFYGGIRRIFPTLIYTLSVR